MEGLNDIRQWHIVKHFKTVNKKKKAMHKKYADIILATMNTLEKYAIDIEPKGE